MGGCSACSFPHGLSWAVPGQGAGHRLMHTELAGEGVILLVP